MTRPIKSIPHKLIESWIRDDDVHVLKDVVKPAISALDAENSNLVQTVLTSKGGGSRSRKRNHISLGSLILSFRVFMKNGMARRKSARELYQLSEHGLRDIGLSSSDISSLARGRVSIEELNQIRLQGWTH